MTDADADADAGASAGADASAEADAATPGWRDILSDARSPSGRAPRVSTPPTRSAADAAPASESTRLGLLFELRRLSTKDPHRWEGPKVTTATPPLDRAAEYRLAVRPVLASGTGNWVRAGITWSSMGYQQHRLGLDPAQHRWFAQFGALQRSTRELFGTQEAEWLYLDDFQSPLLWPMLADAQRLGIALVTGKKSMTVRVTTDAALSLLAARDDRGLTLTTVLTVDGASVDTTCARPIGDHGVYVASLTPRPAFVLAAAPAPLSDEHRGVLRREALTIPAADVDEFIAEYLPRLRGRIPVLAEPGVLPERRAPELVLTATFIDASPGGEADAAQLSLEWEWPDGEPDAEHRAQLDAAISAVAELLGQKPHPLTLHGIEAAEFTTRVLPALEELPSVRVEIVGDRPDYRELTEAPHLTITAVESTRRDWFDLGVLVTVEGRTVPFTPLYRALVEGRTKLMLVDRSYLSLQHPAFDGLKRLISESSELGEWETGPRISRYQAAVWADFEDLADETIAATEWRAAARGLRDLSDIEPVDPPPGLAVTLRGYQQRGLDWLAFLHRHRLGGILADDMGLGKTVQALALIAHARARARSDGSLPPKFLVVAPTSVVPNWVGEAARYTPGLVVRSVTESQRTSGRSIGETADAADIVVTSYALFRLDFAGYQSVQWGGLILDEAQFVKNPSSRAHACAVDLDAPVKFALTGTPLENSLLDLWSLFAIVAPGLFASKRRFTEDYVGPISRGDSREYAAAQTEKLRRRIRPLMLRRTKELVASELPPKQEQVLRVDLAPPHRKLYDTYLQRERQKLLGVGALAGSGELDRNRFIVFRSLTLLRLLSLDPSLIDPDYSDIASAKLDALLERLHDVAAEGHRALVFSQFTSFLKLAARRLDRAGIAHEYLDGSTLHRASVIDAFRDGDAPVFLISLKAGGFGLNLTEADYVFLLDPWWNPAAEAQAVDRTHRIGQTRQVFVYRMVASDTIEEKVMALRDRKATLFDAVVDDDAMFSQALTADDVRGLLEA